MAALKRLNQIVCWPEHTSNGQTRAGES